MKHFDLQKAQTLTSYQLTVGELPYVSIDKYAQVSHMNKGLTMSIDRALTYIDTANIVSAEAEYLSLKNTIQNHPFVYNTNKKHLSQFVTPIHIQYVCIVYSTCTV